MTGTLRTKFCLTKLISMSNTFDDYVAENFVECDLDDYVGKQKWNIRKKE